jgi:hypothetical protein
MQAESLEVLEKADVAAPQARAIVRAIEIEIAGAKDTLATKHDLVLLSSDLRGEMSGLHAQMSELRTEMRAEMTELRIEMRAEMSDLRAEIRAEMSESRAELTAKIETTVPGVVRQMYAAMLGQMAVLLGFSHFLATHVR